MSAICIGYNAEEMEMVRTRHKKRPSISTEAGLTWNPQGRRREEKLRNTWRREFEERDEEVLYKL